MVAVAVVDVKSESLYVQNGTVSELVTGLLMFWGVGIAFPGKCNHKAQSAYMHGDFKKGFVSALGS